MTTLRDPSPYPAQGKSDGRNPQKEEVRLISVFREVTNQAGVTTARKSCLETGALHASCIEVDFF